jgi:ornithine decarboxylase
VEERWQGDALLRILVDDTKSVVPFGRKFGIPLSEVAAISKYAERKLALAGISFHVGSGCQDVSQYTRAIEQASESIEILREHHHAHVIDIGGGFTEDSFSDSARVIRRAIRDIPPHTCIIAEPGRYFSEGSHALFVKVIGKKANNGRPGYRYTIDESVYGQFSCIPFDCAKPTWIRIGEGVRKKTPAILFGRTCDSVDMIAMSDSTEELMEGDWLLFPRMGAYTSVTSSEFNGFPRPPVHVIEESLRYLIPTIENRLVQENRLIHYVSPVTVPALRP